MQFLLVVNLLMFIFILFIYLFIYLLFILFINIWQCFFSKKIMFEVKSLLNVKLSVVYFYSRRFNYAKFKTVEAEGV